MELLSHDTSAIEIAIPMKLLVGYVGNISGLFELDFGHPVGHGEHIPNEYLVLGKDSARRLGDLRIVELGLRSLLLNQLKEYSRFHMGEMEVEAEGMTWLIGEIARSWFPIEDFRLSNLLGRVRLVEMQREEWREKIKPGILKMLRAEGIEP
jgi:hypothetical protein